MIRKRKTVEATALSLEDMMKNIIDFFKPSNTSQPVFTRINSKKIDNDLTMDKLSMT